MCVITEGLDDPFPLKACWVCTKILWPIFIVTKRIQEYSIDRNILAVLIRKCKQLYCKTKLDLSRIDSNETWNILNGMLGWNSNEKQVSLSVNDVPLASIQTVNHFNAYFTSVASD